MNHALARLAAGLILGALLFLVHLCAGAELPQQIGRYQLISGELYTSGLLRGKFVDMREPAFIRIDTDTGLAWKLESTTIDGTNRTRWAPIDPGEHTERMAFRWWLATNQPTRTATPPAPAK